MSSLPSTIKAIGFRKNGDFDVIEELKDLTFPQKKEDEILIKVEYGGVNFIDTYERSGLVSRLRSGPLVMSQHRRLYTRQYATSSFPKVLGQEASGTIVALPTAKDLLEDEEYKLRGFSLGDKVVAVSVTSPNFEKLNSNEPLVDLRLFCRIPLSTLAQSRQATFTCEHKGCNGSGCARSHRCVPIRHALRTLTERFPSFA